MYIDTRYRDSLTIVEMVLQVSARERALTDADLIRIAINQHKLRWLKPEGKVAVTQAALRERVPSGKAFEVTRDGDDIAVLIRERTAVSIAA